jgi:diguanylate cyclase (GGDEF)-like protein
MEELIEAAQLTTIRTEITEAPPPQPSKAILVQIYPPCLDMNSRQALDNKPLEIGRGGNCGFRINHDSVSRRHARIEPTPSGYDVVDLGSTNGTFVNNVQVTESPLRDADYLRIGSCMFRFLMGSNLEAAYHEEIYRLTIVDALTEVHTKRYFLEFLDRELARSRHYRRPLSLVLFDLDHFKNINDSQGHLGGDHTLRDVAARVRPTIRREELVARYGGEEFAVVLPEIQLADAVAIAERIRAAVGTEPFTYDGEVFSVTVSLGVATTAEGQVETAEQLIRHADEALYSAKSAGRNCVRAYSHAAAGASPSPAEV